MHKNLKDILKLNVKKKEMTNGKIKTNKKASVAKNCPHLLSGTLLSSYYAMFMQWLLYHW